jgi:tetratricopeptide (TPR) repeat protein
LKRELGHKPGEAAALAALGAVELDRGRVAEGRERFDAAADLATATDGRSVLANAIAGRGEIAFESGEVSPAREHLTSALGMWQELRRAAKVDETRVALARLGLEAGEPRSALSEIEALLADSRSRSAELASRIALLDARTRAALGRTGAAREALQRARELSARSENPATALQLTATALVLSLAGVPGDPPAAADVARDVTVARQRGFEPLALELEILAARGELRANPAAAREALEKLARACEERGLRRLARQASDAATRG